MSNITEAVKEKYGNIAKQAAKGAKASCCSSDASCNPVTSDLYASGETAALPVLAEAFRVLKPGGRFAVSDIVRRKPLAPAVAQSLEAWAGCVAGALEEKEYTSLLREAGFREVGVEPTRIYRAEDAKALLPEAD